MGNWPATLKCFSDFVHCAIGGCKDPSYALLAGPDYTPDQAAVDVYLMEHDGAYGLLAEVY